MRCLKRLSIVVVLLLPVIIQAQASDEEVRKEKQRRVGLLVDQILADAQDLKLSENRAHVYARTGAILWNTDKKRARTLFQNAVSELIAARDAAASSNKALAFQIDMLNQSIRPSILNTIAARDAEFALESFYRSRPAILQRAIEAQGAKPSKISNIGTNYEYLINNERNLEQSLMRMAAEQSPERAVKLLKAAIDRGFSDETPNLLKRLNDKDPETASELAKEIIGKLIDKGFNTNERPDYRKLNLATNLLNEAVREKSPNDKGLQLDPSQERTLAEKLIAYHTGDNRSEYFSFYALLPIAEKFVPASVARIKELGKANVGRGWGDYDPDVSKLLSSDATAEKLLGEAKKFPMNSRRQIYQSAASKYAQEGDITSALAVVNENFSDDALTDAVNNLNSQYSYSLIGAGKYADAERVIDEFPENARLSALVNLANSIYGADTEKNRSHAALVLGKARALLPDKPENSNDLQGFTQVMYAFASIEPTEAFRMFESLVPQLNELTDAAAILNAFQGGSGVKQGEFLISQGNFGVYMDMSSLRPLGAKDFDRTMKLVDSFSRREIRTMLRLQMAENEGN
jgi:hypothetical protein